MKAAHTNPLNLTNGTSLRWIDLRLDTAISADLLNLILLAIKEDSSCDVQDGFHCKQ